MPSPAQLFTLAAFFAILQSNDKVGRKLRMREGKKNTNASGALARRAVTQAQGQRQQAQTARSGRLVWPSFRPTTYRDQLVRPRTNSSWRTGGTTFAALQLSSKWEHLHGLVCCPAVMCGHFACFLAHCQPAAAWCASWCVPAAMGACCQQSAVLAAAFHWLPLIAECATLLASHAVQAAC